MGSANVAYDDGDREDARREGQPLFTIDLDYSHLGDPPGGTSRMTLRGRLPEAASKRLVTFMLDLMKELAKPGK